MEWRSAVNRSLKELLDADYVTFRIPGSEPDLVTTEHAQPVTGGGENRLHAPEHRLTISERALELGAFNRELLLGIQLPANHDSEYSNDYIVVNQACDWLALVAALPPQSGTTRVAQIVMHKDAASGREFGNRGLALVRLLFPGFRSGIITHCRTMEERRVLGGVIDRLSDGMLVCDARGKVVYQSAVLTSMLEVDGEGAMLLGKMHAVGRELAALLATPDARRDDADFSENVRTVHAWYRVRGTIVGEGVLSPAFRIIVALEQLSPTLPSEADVRQRFGLTPKEARVC